MATVKTVLLVLMSAFYVFPANIHAAIAEIPGRGGYGRLPFQALLIAWAWWYTRR